VPEHRCARVPTFQKEAGISGDEVSSRLTQEVEAFGDAFARAEPTASGLDRVRTTLIEMLCAVPQNVPVMYPPGPGDGLSENYRWFVANKRGQGLLLPEPDEERREPGGRLVGEPG
jgi:hypothetical protein